MMLGMAGKAPLLLAAFLFGIGASGLVLLSLADRTAWGPFRPQVLPRPPQRVIVIDVGTPFTPPPLEELLAGRDDARVEALTAGPAEPTAAGQDVPPPTPTPIPPIRIHGVAASDGVSAAGTTPTPPPPVRVVNVAVGGDAPDDGEPPADSTPPGDADPGDE
jgi:hypothetical protein